MPDRPERVVPIVRHREAVLVCGGAAARSLPIRPVDGADPETALRGLLDQLGIAAGGIERRGESVEVDDARLLPFLVGATGRDVSDTEACREPDWISPTTLLRAADDRWWRAYEAVAPTVETVASDSERGSTAIAIDALWVLRDAVGRAAVRGEDRAAIETTAIALLEARPSMAALENRVNRAMAETETPAEVEQAATNGIVRAAEADVAAARLAAETVDGGTVLTLSRSGTVLEALRTARPDVIVLESRPGGEGHEVAGTLADAGLSVSTVPDGEVYGRLRSGDVDAVLVGADAVTPEGGVVNKVGTRAAALAAAWAGVPCFAVCASDKVRPASGGEDADAPPHEPLFDWTPPRLLTAILTERGRLGPDDIRAIAAEHAQLARWRA